MFIVALCGQSPQGEKHRFSLFGIRHKESFNTAPAGLKIQGGNSYD